MAAAFPLQTWLETLDAFLTAHPEVGYWYTTVVRFVFPVLAGLILLRAIRSLLRVPHTPETWAQLSMPNGAPAPLTHWENIIGRNKNADVVLNYPSISRQHAALIRNEDATWTVHDLDSKGGVLVNGEKVEGKANLQEGDTITLGGVPLMLLPTTVAEKEQHGYRRLRTSRSPTVCPSSC